MARKATRELMQADEQKLKKIEAEIKQLRLAQRKIREHEKGLKDELLRELGEQVIKNMNLSDDAIDQGFIAIQKLGEQHHGHN